MEGIENNNNNENFIEEQSVLQTECEEEFDVFDSEEDFIISTKKKLKLYKRVLHLWFKKKKKQDFKNILFVTYGNVPKDFFNAFRCQYPDKNIKVLVPVLPHKQRVQKTSISFEFFLQNKKHQAILYKFPLSRENIEIYGIYISDFLGLEDFTQIKHLNLLAPLAKAIRICAKFLAPDIIHSENIPFFLGSEFEKKKAYPIRVVQVVHDFLDYEMSKTEAFWATLNLVNKQGLKKIYSDKIIRKCIASLFKLHNTKRFYQMKECLDYIYKNYTKFRKFVDKCDDIEENILFNRLNARILELFPQMRQNNENAYNNIFSSIKKSDSWAVYSQTYYNELFKNETLTGSLFELVNKTRTKSGYLVYGADFSNDVIYHDFSIENFREFRQKNKQKLIKEFSKERVETKFIDRSLFKDYEFEVYGYLDSFYTSPLLFVTLKPTVFSQGVDIAFNVLLKLVKEFRNIQFIINIPNGMSKGYIKSWVDFLQSLPDARGRWVFINSQVHAAKFFASSDILISPKRGNIVDSKFYEAMKYGCIPVLSRTGMYNDVVVDIFDDISKGCGFKTKSSLFIADDVNEIYYQTIKKALNMYMNNPASWNLLIKNSMNYDSTWNFGIIEKYNDLYSI